MMTKECKLGWMAAGIVVTAILLDQLLKFYIANHYMLGESREVLPFFYLCYVLNDGMAFGIEWFDKIFLTLFRILACGVIGWYMYRLIHINHARTGYITMVSLVMAGAMGNILDCIFYGKIYGYAGWGYGKVVDMLYFPLIKNAAGECLFFRPVFNLADSCITVAIICIILWFRKDMDQSMSRVKKDE